MFLGSRVQDFTGFDDRQAFKRKAVFGRSLDTHELWLG